MAEPDMALVSYLDTLLSEIEDVRDVEPLTEIKGATPAADTRRQEGQAETGLVTRDEPDEPIIPAWAETAFQALMFQVRGLTLGVPLTSLVSILEWRESASILPGQPAWHLGVLVSRGQKVVIVDTAQLVMPERVSAKDSDNRPPGGYLLLVGDGYFALAVDAIASTVILKKEQVRWRSVLGARPWLAGTMIVQLSALLDVDGLLEMIAA
jgi:purine-binding chemotaxis protein CheW